MGYRPLAAALGACTLWGVLAAGEANAGFDATAQTRSVRVDITRNTLSCLPPPTGCQITGTTNFFDHEAAPSSPPFLPFSATAMVPPYTGSFASQDSSIAASAILAQGATQNTGSASLTTPPNVYTAISSQTPNVFSTSFNLAEPTPVRLVGSVTSTGGLSGNTTTRITLKTAGGLVLAEVVAATDPNCQDPSCAQVGPLPITWVGVLAPGAYVIEANSTGSATAFYFANQFFTIVTSGEYELKLTATQVPALSPRGLGLLALALGLAALATSSVRQERSDQHRAQ